MLNDVSNIIRIVNLEVDLLGKNIDDNSICTPILKQAVQREEGNGQQRNYFKSPAKAVCREEQNLCAHRRHVLKSEKKITLIHICGNKLTLIKKEI